MISCNNQGIKLLPYNVPKPLYDKKYALCKTWGWLRMARLIAYGPSGIFILEGLGILSWLLIFGLHQSVIF